MSYENYRGLDTHDCMNAADDEQRPYTLRAGDREAHPMLALGMDQKTGEAEGIDRVGTPMELFYYADMELHSDGVDEAIVELSRKRR